MNYVERDLMRKAKIESAVARRCALEAGNTQRAISGLSPAYTEEDFFEISDELDAIAKEIEATP